MLRITSCSLKPALPAGASWSTIVTSTPFSSFNFSAESRSEVTSLMSTPRYDPVLESSLGNPKGGGGATDQFCSAWEKLSRRGNTANELRIDLRIVIALRMVSLSTAVLFLDCHFSSD